MNFIRNDQDIISPADLVDLKQFIMTEDSARRIVRMAHDQCRIVFIFAGCFKCLAVDRKVIIAVIDHFHFDINAAIAINIPMITVTGCQDDDSFIWLGIQFYAL